MSRIRVTANCEALFVGPAPSTGYHFIDNSGVLNDNYNELLNNNNLLFELIRVTDVNYEVSPNRTNVLGLGKLGCLCQPIINRPTVNLSIEYNLMGLINEARLGFNVNYARFEYPYSGQSFYPNNVCPLSGFYDKNFTRDMSTQPYWPLTYRDKRNLFLVIAKEGEDAHYSYVQDFNPDIYQGLDPQSNTRKVLAFGNSYVTSYRSQGAVGSFPKASVNLIAENMAFYLSGSGTSIPAIEAKSGTPVTGVHFVIPNSYKDNGPSVLLPGDITVSISGTQNLTVNISDAKIESYVLDFSLNRKFLDGLGYKYPLDRPVDFPVNCDVAFSMLVGDGHAGSFYNLFSLDENYDVTIKMLNPSSFIPPTGNPKTDGFTNVYKAVAIRHDLIKAKFKGISFKESFGNNKMANLAFQCSIDPTDLSQGLFISGLLNIAKTQDYLLDNSGNYILYNDGTPIVLDLPPIY